MATGVATFSNTSATDVFCTVFILFMVSAETRALTGLGVKPPTTIALPRTSRQALFRRPVLLQKRTSCNICNNDRRGVITSSLGTFLTPRLQQ